MSSSRLPGKPLAFIGGKTMINHVYDSCKKSDADGIYVATDSQEIYDHVKMFGECIVTPEFDSGTRRVCFAAKPMLDDYDYFINVQGDEPFIDVHFLNLFIRDIQSIRNGTILTGISELNENHLRNRNSVKAIMGKDDYIISFTRSYFFEKSDNVFKHIGIYGFCSGDIDRISNIETTEESILQSLEQISWMEEGFLIKSRISYSESVCVDTIEDLEFVRTLNSGI